MMLWVALRYAGISENWPMVEAVTVWGYAMFVWIPVSVRDIVSVLAVPFFNRVGLDTLHYSYRPSSLGFIRYRVCSVGLFPCHRTSNLRSSPPYVILVPLSPRHGPKLFHFSQANQKPVRLLIVVIAVLHAVIALLFKVLFFSYYVETNIGPADPTL